EIINHGFPIANGDIVIQIGREHQFQRLVEVLDQPEWLTDNRFASRKGWLDNIEVIRSAIYLWAGNRSSVEVADALAAAGIAAAPVFTASDVVTDPHVANRNMVMSYSLTDGGPEVMTPGNPVKLSKVAEGPDTPPPSLGQQTNDILREELNLSLDEITTLRDSGVVR
ncbi:MAG: CoA transferase, partial [Acidimicrobiales bacterium]